MDSKTQPMYEDNKSTSSAHDQVSDPKKHSPSRKPRQVIAWACGTSLCWPREVLMLLGTSCVQPANTHFCSCDSACPGRGGRHQWAGDNPLVVLLLCPVRTGRRNLALKEVQPAYSGIPWTEYMHVTVTCIMRKNKSQFIMTKHKQNKQLA